MERSIRGIVNAVCAFGLGFVGAAVLIRTVLPPPLRLYAEERSEKLAMLDAMAATADSAAFGSSHVQDGFDPRAFDRSLDAIGVHLRTLNLGIHGGSQTEQRAMALAFFDALKRHGSRPKLVMLEITAGANLTPDHLMHPRTINLYDPATVRFATAFAKGDLPRAQRLGRIGFALAAGLLNAMNVGMLSNRVFNHPLDSKIVESDEGDDRRGVADHAGEPLINPEMRSSFEPAAPNAPPSPVPDVVGNRLLVDQLADDARRLFGPEGVPRFVEIAMPMVEDRTAPKSHPEVLQTSVGPVPILNFEEAGRYPGLYQLPFWHDPAHLSAAGAVAMANSVAQELRARGVTRDLESRRALR